MQVCERAAAAEGGGGAYRRARRDGQRVGERGRKRQGPEGPGLKALLLFSFVLPSLFCFAFPLAKREKRDKAEYQSCGVVWFVASTQWIVSRRVDNL